ncbi:hypothetical protein V2J09_010154 [Rumex salicifolius]
MCEVLLLPLPGDAADIVLRLERQETFALSLPSANAAVGSAFGGNFSAAIDSASCSDFVRARPSVEFAFSIPIWLLLVCLDLPSNYVLTMGQKAWIAEPQLSCSAYRKVYDD